jgi:hypothetical protein
MKVHLLTVEEKNLLVGQKFNSFTYFNPSYSKEGFWFVSVDEVSQYDGYEFIWVKDLPLINYIPYYEEI